MEVVGFVEGEGPLIEPVDVEPRVAHADPFQRFIAGTCGLVAPGVGLSGEWEAHRQGDGEAAELHQESAHVGECPVGRVPEQDAREVAAPQSGNARYTHTGSNSDPPLGVRGVAASTTVAP